MIPSTKTGRRTVKFGEDEPSKKMERYVKLQKEIATATKKIEYF
jgi:hypothetical protein